MVSYLESNDGESTAYDVIYKAMIESQRHMMLSTEHFVQHNVYNFLLGIFLGDLTENFELFEIMLSDFECVI